MRLFARTACYEDTLACGRDILAIDPLRESVQRMAKLLYVLNGQRAEAIHQFNRCRHLSRSECDVEPMPQTENLGGSSAPAWRSISSRRSGGPAERGCERAGPVSRTLKRKAAAATRCAPRDGLRTPKQQTR